MMTTKRITRRFSNATLFIFWVTRLFGLIQCLLLKQTLPLFLIRLLLLRKDDFAELWCGHLAMFPVDGNRRDVENV